MMNEDDVDMVSKALQKAWLLGQKYWMQAESDSFLQHRKSDETYENFQQLVADTREALEKACGVEK